MDVSKLKELGWNGVYRLRPDGLRDRRRARLRLAQPGLHRGHVDDVHQDGAALDVPEELHAEGLSWAEELVQRFDIVILDTPPVLATADAGIVASLTDGVLLVVRAGTTDRNAAQRACQQLANVGARVVGTVLNDPGGQVAKEGDYYYPYDYAAEEQ